MGSWAERTRGKAEVGGPGQARWWLADPARQQTVEWGRQVCSWPARSSWKILRGRSWWTWQSHIHTQIYQEEQRGSKIDRPTPGLQCRKIKPQTSDWKPLGGWGSSGRNSQTHRRVHWRDPQGPRTYTNPPTWESAPEGPTLLVGSGGSDWKLAESRASTIATFWTPSPYTTSQRSDVGCPSWVNT